MPVDDAGLASGLFNTSQQIGGALGLALLSTFAANKTADVLSAAGGEPTQAETAQALVDGFHVAWIGCAVVPRGRRRAAASRCCGAVTCSRSPRASPPGRHVDRRPHHVKIAPFRIEQYYAVHEFTAPHMLSSSDAESVSVADLLALEPDAAERLLAQRLGYTESPGAPELRAAIAAIYETTTPDDVIVVAAAEEGIFVAYHALLEPGDHVVVETPCYESALQVARSTGAEVTAWRRSAADGWAHDLDALERALRPGHEARLRQHAAQSDRARSCPATVLDRVVELCAERGAWLFCDEVYRELEHDPADRLPAAVRPLRPRDLARLDVEDLRAARAAPRLARLARPRRARAASSTSSTTRRSARAPRASCSARSRSGIATCSPSATARSCSRTSRSSTRSSSRHAEHFSWTRPTASPIGFARVDGVEDTTAFCERLVAEAGVLLLPGAVYDEPAHVRIGFGRSALPEALRTVRAPGSKHVLNAARLGSANDPQGFRTTCRYTLSSHTHHPPERRLHMGDATEAHDVDRLVPLRAARARARPCGGILVRDCPLRRGAESHRCP